MEGEGLDRETGYERNDICFYGFAMWNKGHNRWIVQSPVVKAASQLNRRGNGFSPWPLPSMLIIFQFTSIQLHQISRICICHVVCCGWVCSANRVTLAFHSIYDRKDMRYYFSGFCCKSERIEWTTESNKHPSAWLIAIIAMEISFIIYIQCTVCHSGLIE